jgi:hypothetical protein
LVVGIGERVQDMQRFINEELRCNAVSHTLGGKSWQGRLIPLFAS